MSTLTPQSRKRFFKDWQGFDAIYLDKDAVEQHSVDFSRLLGSDTISTAAVTGNGVTIDSSSNTTTTVTFTLSGASDGAEVKIHVTTAAGIEWDETIRIYEVTA